MYEHNIFFTTLANLFFSLYHTVFIKKIHLPIMCGYVCVWVYTSDYTNICIWPLVIKCYPYISGADL